MKTQQTMRDVNMIVVGLLVAITLGRAAAQGRYQVTDIGSPPGVTDSYLWQQDVNNRGHVAAYGNNAANPNAFAGDASFLWKGPEEVEMLSGLPGATDTLATGLNDRDQAVGDSGAADFSNAHAVLWDHGLIHDLGTLPGDTGSDANYLNNDGVVVGDSYSATGLTLRGAGVSRPHFSWNRFLAGHCKSASAEDWKQ